MSWMAIQILMFLSATVHHHPIVIQVSLRELRKHLQFLSSYQSPSSSIQHKRHEQPDMGHRRSRTEATPFRGLGNAHKRFRLPCHAVHAFAHCIYVTQSSLALALACFNIIDVRLGNGLVSSVKEIVRFICCT